jgi:hypothetical protein
MTSIGNRNFLANCRNMETMDSLQHKVGDARQLFLLHVSKQVPQVLDVDHLAPNLKQTGVRFCRRSNSIDVGSSALVTALV